MNSAERVHTALKTGLLTVVPLVPLGALHAADTATPPADRNLPINQISPPVAFYQNGKGARVLDATKPPFNAKGDGVTDCTNALCAATGFINVIYTLARYEQLVRLKLIPLRTA